MFRPLRPVRRRRLLALVLAASTIAFAGACGSSGSSPGTSASGGTTKLKVGVIPIVDVAPIYLQIRSHVYGLIQLAKQGHRPEAG